MADRFAQAKAALPIRAPADWELSAIRHRDDRTLTLHVAVPAGLNQDGPDVGFFPEDLGVVDNAAPQTVWKTQATPGYTIQLKRSSVATSPPTRLRGVLVSQEGWFGPGSARALQVDVPITPSLPR